MVYHRLVKAEPRADGSAGPLVLEVFDDRRLDRIVECITTVWCTDNVIAQALGVTEDEYRPVARRICQEAIEDDLGLMLREPGTDRIVGFGTAIDLVDELRSIERTKETASPRMQRWSEFLSRALRWYLDQFHPEHPPQRGEVMYMNIGGTLREFRGQGWIGRMTQQAFTKFVMNRSYSRLVAVATHPHSIAMARSFPLPTRLHEIRYASLDDPDLSRITEPPIALVIAASLRDPDAP